MSSQQPLDIPRRDSPVGVRGGHAHDGMEHSMQLMGLDDVGAFSSANAWTAGSDSFTPRFPPQTPLSEASDSTQRSEPPIPHLETSTDSLPNEGLRPESAMTPSTTTSPAAQWLGSLNSSIGSPSDSNDSPNSMLSHLRRSASTRPRRSGRTSSSAASSFSSLERLPSIGQRERPPRADQEGYAFGPNTRYRLGRAIGFGESSTVFEGTSDESAPDHAPEGKEPRKVAIKVLRHSKHTQETKSQTHELDVWRSLPRHPHLLSLIHYEQIREPQETQSEKERILDLLVMDYSAYGNLLQFVRREGALPDRRTRQPTPSTQSSPFAGQPRQCQSEASSWSASARNASGPHYGSLGNALAISLSPHAETSRPVLRSVSQRHRSRGVPIDVAREIMRHIASGLYSLHKVASVVHCDLKLENILAFAPDEALDEGGISPIAWKIADFGLAEHIHHDRRQSSGDRAASLGGTLAYAAPEVVRYIDFDMAVPNNVPSHAPPITDQFHSPFARDMWSLGCILYALLTGHLPFVDGMQVRLQRKILAGEFEMPVRLLTGKERVALEICSDTPEDQLPYRSDPEADTDECRQQAHQVLVNLLELDPTLRWDIDDLCQSPWLSLY